MTNDNVLHSVGRPIVAISVGFECPIRFFGAARILQAAKCLRRLGMPSEKRSLLARVRFHWRRLREYLRRDLWEVDLSGLGKWPGFFVRLIQVIALVWRNFRNDALPIQASALSFTSLMSLVPLLALSFSVLNGLGYGLDVIAYLTSLMDEMPDQFQGFVGELLGVVQNTNFARLGGIGGVLLLIIVVQMLGKIEAAFNRVWRVTRHRSFLQKVAQYISIVVVVPILFTAGVTLTAKIRFGGEWMEHLGLIRLAPTVATCLALVFLYTYMPNVRVRFVPALISSILVAVLWQAWLQFYITVQPGVTKLNVLYGTLASVPIFLAWLYVNWVIVLLGAEVCFAVQNYASLSQQKQIHDAATRTRMKVCLLVLVWCARALHGKTKLLTRDAFLETYPIPLNVFHEAIALLQDAELVGETADDPERFVLFKAPQEIAVHDVIATVLDHPGKATHLSLQRLDESISEAMDDLDAGMARVLEGRTIWDLVSS